MSEGEFRFERTQATGVVRSSGQGLVWIGQGFNIALQLLQQTPQLWVHARNFMQSLMHALQGCFQLFDMHTLSPLSAGPV